MRAAHRVAAAGIALGAVLSLAATTASSADAESPDAGTVRVEAATDGDLEAAASARVAAMSVREKAASVVMGHIPTTDAAALRDYMEETGIGGFILMGANIPDGEAAVRAVTAGLTVDPAFPPLIAVDQEGGDVSRLGGDAFASALALKGEPAAAAQQAFAGRGGLVQRAGIGVNFGIVADQTDDPGSFIYRRALGTSPKAAAERVAAAVEGEAPESLSTLKHFPGHGAAPGDSHSGIPSSGMSKARWRAADALPFEAGIDAGAALLMFGHLAYTAVDPAPASLSAEWHRIAREELGFGGVAVTDDLGMLQGSGVAAYADPVANAVSALAAGNDLVLAVMFSNARTAPDIVDGIVAAVESGELDPQRLDEAATRVAVLRMGLAADGRGLMPCADCAPVD
ncbi:glycoside hydrolase family 3 N-terminal domain-containing protein [Microbacterium sp. CFBP9034]|uniref:glycoside hydrolase family 3 N-terminal domain-containing protein n=1 Tax=Microbacterium sp. CFBP9034 TaxID=3096540 RepID=UPI002A6A377A|nr:glycoside hydrolase family 3 N-terminal domain-containing protein [Microbacterium sp. CFBP9034]MDY0909631.1 glycoside hydrolase family 3 N-terminal domain-containing protein [Microbacterium sp. CFBP9034]